MKLLWVVPGGVDPSGVERVIPVFLWHIQRLASRHELHVVALRQHSSDTDYDLLGARIHSLGPRRTAALIPAIGRIIQRHGPFDALHALDATGGAAAAVVLGRVTATPAIVTLLGGELVALPSIEYGGALRWRVRIATRIALRGASVVTCQSAFIQTRARAHGIVAEQTPLGVDRQRFSPRIAEPPGPPWRLLHVASLNHVKDQTTLLRAFQRVRAAEPDTGLDIVGEDTLDGRIEQLARDLGVADAVRFHGYRPWTTLADAYHRAHLFVMTSLHESGPIAAIEAAACGVPLVGTRVGYFADWEDARLAAVAAPGDDRALAERIIALLRNPQERRAMAERARLWAEQHDADRTAFDLERLYQRVSAHTASSWRPSVFRS